MREDWVECTFGEIIYFKNGFAFKSSDYINDGIPIIRIGDIKQNQISLEDSKKVKESNDLDEYLIRKGDILIAMSGATTGKFGMYNLELKAYLNQRVGNIFPISQDLIYKPFLFYLLHFLKRQIEKDAYGGAQPNISSKKIEEMKVPFIPLPEQRAIVKKIEALFSSLDAGIADLKKAQDQLKIYRQAVLKKAFEGDWQLVKLGMIFDFIGGGTPSKKEDGYWNGDIPWASIKDIKGDYLNTTQDFITQKGLENSASNIAKSGDVILATRINPGRSIITNIDTAINQDLKVVKTKYDYNSKFIHYLFKSIEDKCLKVSSGTTVLGITLTNLKDIEIPKIENTEEQAQIVKEIESRLSVCDAVEKQIKDSLDQAEALRQSILKKAFEGSLLTEEEIHACKQEPDYEPASVLLEKIKTEKEANKPIKKKKTKTKLKIN